MIILPPSLQNKALAYKQFFSHRDNFLKEASSPSENNLQKMWNERSFPKTMFTTQGKEVNFIDFGYCNELDGPDFKQVVIKLDDKIISGDVELDLIEENWFRHKHNKNPHFSHVILQLVWEKPQKASRHNLPIICLQDFLPKDMLPYAFKAKKNQKINGQSPLFSFQKHSHKQIKDILSAVGFIRLENKIDIFKRLKQFYSWDEILYIKLFEALGYSKNKQQFNHLCQRISLKNLKMLSSNQEREALIWGISSLLPDYSQESIAKEHLIHTKKIWDIWGHIRERYHPPISWSQVFQRPSNSPYRRLAAGIEFLNQFSYNLSIFIEELISLIPQKKAFFQYIKKSFEFNSLWNEFYSFTKKSPKAIQLIGTQRKDEIIINIIFPFLLAYLSSEQKSFQLLVIEYYRTYKKLPNNQKISLAIQRFIGEENIKKIPLKNLEQQGLIQIFDDFHWENMNNEKIKSFWEDLDVETFILPQ